MLRADPPETSQIMKLQSKDDLYFGKTSPVVWQLTERRSCVTRKGLMSLASILIAV